MENRRYFKLTLEDYFYINPFFFLAFLTNILYAFNGELSMSKKVITTFKECDGK